MIANNIDEVIENLNTIIRTSKDEESTLGYFAALYQKVTKTIRGKLGKNYFDDDDRMEQLDVIFANRYLQAYSDFKEGKKITKSWEIAFESSKKKNLIVLQHLLVGMSAHINLDLGIAAAEITDKTTIQDLKSDFNKINEILSTLIDGVERDLSDIWPKLKGILKFLKGADKFLINFSMSIARDGAWKFAKELTFRDSNANLNDMITKRDETIFKLSDSIVNQGFIERMIFWIIRLGEKGTTAEKIALLEK